MPRPIDQRNHDPRTPKGCGYNAYDAEGKPCPTRCGGVCTVELEEVLPVTGHFGDGWHRVWILCTRCDYEHRTTTPPPRRTESAF